MKFFKTGRQIELSPKLSRSIGRGLKPKGYYLHKMLVIALLLVGLSVLLPSNFTSQAQSAGGEVLGEQNKNIIYHTVRNGDTITKISERYGVYWLIITEENELKAPYLLQPGQILKIPNY